MTEAEWLTSADSWAMLQHLRGLQGDRKVRLFAVGCCRQVWDSIQTVRCRRAVEVAERFADGWATASELRQAQQLAANSVRNFEKPAGRILHSEPELISLVDLKLAADTVRPTAEEIIDGLARLRLDPGLARLAPGLLRCVFGPRPDSIVPFDPSLVSSSAMTLARSIDENRDFDTMPVLGDALEEAGCTDDAILRHCRSREPHVRGCWVVDLILEKS